LKPAPGAEPQHHDRATAIFGTLLIATLKGSTIRATNTGTRAHAQQRSGMLADDKTQMSSNKFSRCPQAPPLPIILNRH